MEKVVKEGEDAKEDPKFESTIVIGSEGYRKKWNGSYKKKFFLEDFEEGLMI